MLWCLESFRGEGAALLITGSGDRDGLGWKERKDTSC